MPSQIKMNIANIKPANIFITADGILKILTHRFIVLAAISGDIHRTSEKLVQSKQPPVRPTPKNSDMPV